MKYRIFKLIVALVILSTSTLSGQVGPMSKLPVKVYPNPFYNHLIIEDTTLTNLDSLSIRIVSVKDGTILDFGVYSIDYHMLQIDVDSLNRGSYIIFMITPRGFSSKLIIK